jgi:uncharacterized protein
MPDRPTSYAAMRFEATVPQNADFTCGAASIATLLTYYWGTPTTEAAALATLKHRYTEAEIKSIGEHGLSFDDLIFMSNKLGFVAQGAKVSLDQLANLSGPVIAHLDKGAFQHFVVLQRVGESVYYIADPIVGQLAMSADEFGTQYTGNALAIWKADADLPSHSMLTNPRDGIRVGDSLRRIINVPALPFQPGV